MTTYPDGWVRLDRDTPVPAPTPEQWEAEAIVPPEPGTGTLWVHQPYPGVWRALWLGDAGFAGYDGPEDVVIAWARQQPAARVNLIAEVDSFFDRVGDCEPAPPPAPGTGEVWVMEFRGVWHAAWHSDTGFVLFDTEDREMALGWARRQPSLGVMLSENGLPHRRLNDDT